MLKIQNIQHICNQFVGKSLTFPDSPYCTIIINTYDRLKDIKNIYNLMYIVNESSIIKEIFFLHYWLAIGNPFRESILECIYDTFCSNIRMNYIEGCIMHGDLQRYF